MPTGRLGQRHDSSRSWTPALCRRGGWRNGGSLIFTLLAAATLFPSSAPGGHLGPPLGRGGKRGRRRIALAREVWMILALFGTGNADLPARDRRLVLNFRRGSRQGLALQDLIKQSLHFVLFPILKFSGTRVPVRVFEIAGVTPDLLDLASHDAHHAVIHQQSAAAAPIVDDVTESGRAALHGRASSRARAWISWSSNSRSDRFAAAKIRSTTSSLAT